jgi:hypothetical protein
MKRHGIKVLKICRDKSSFDHEAIEKCIDKFASVVTEKFDVRTSL